MKGGKRGRRAAREAKGWVPAPRPILPLAERTRLEDPYDTYERSPNRAIDSYPAPGNYMTERELFAAHGVEPENAGERR